MLDDGLDESIRDRGDLESTGAAHGAATETLRTLGERISHGEVEAIADGLPDELAGAMVGTGGEAEPFGPDEFVARVAGREGDTDPSAAERHVQATLETVRDRVNRLGWRDVRQQLPEEYAALYEVAPPI